MQSSRILDFNICRFLLERRIFCGSTTRESSRRTSSQSLLRVTSYQVPLLSSSVGRIACQCLLREPTSRRLLCSASTNVQRPAHIGSTCIAHLAPPTAHRAPRTTRPAPPTMVCKASTADPAPLTLHLRPCTVSHAPRTSHRVRRAAHRAAATSHCAPSTVLHAPRTLHRAPRNASRARLEAEVRCGDKAVCAESRYFWRSVL